MALKATIFKASLQVSDIDRNYYGEHSLTLARHPSETDERMMMRLLAFALNAHERLEFGKGLADTDEPDLWQKDLSGSIVHWIEVGLPEEKRLIRASGRADRVTVYAYGRGADPWGEANAERLGAREESGSVAGAGRCERICGRACGARHATAVLGTGRAGVV